MRRLLLGFAAALLCQAHASAADRVGTITTRPGITQPLYIAEPDTTPRAVALLYIGAEGSLGLARKMPSTRTGNFLVRIRDPLLAAGILLVYPDVPSDHPRGYGNFRNSPQHVADARAIVAWIRSRNHAPLFIIGTSRGTISASAIAAALPPGTFAGVALTSSVTRQGPRGQEAILPENLARIGVPVLVMHHHDDACPLTPPSDVPRILAELTAAPRKQSIEITGGSPPIEGPCDALAAHGYLGVEDTAAGELVGWMKQ